MYMKLNTTFRHPSITPVSMDTRMASDAPDAQDILETMSAQQRMNDGNVQTCPRCGCRALKPGLYRNALSRYARIYICDTCGGHEAVLAQDGTRWPFQAWAMSKPGFRVKVCQNLYLQRLRRP